MSWAPLPVGATSYQHQLYDFFAHGITYHNASLDSADRWFVEKQFCARALKVLVATSILSAGVNLLTHTVIIFDPITHRTNLYFKPDTEIGADDKVIDHTIVRIMPKNLFFQMCGRILNPFH